MSTPADLTRVMNNARIRLPGAIDSNIKLEMFNTLHEFFADSKCWLDTVTFTTRAGRTSYEVVPDDPATIVSLVRVLDSNDVPVRASMAIPGTIDLDLDPNQSATFTAELMLNVVDPIDRDGYPLMPDWLLAKYYSAILDGLLGKMMSQSAKPYSNERLGIFHMRRFRSSIAVARAEARHGNLYDGQRWQFPLARPRASQR